MYVGLLLSRKWSITAYSLSAGWQWLPSDEYRIGMGGKKSIFMVEKSGRHDRGQVIKVKTSTVRSHGDTYEPLT